MGLACSSARDETCFATSSQVKSLSCVLRVIDTAVLPEASPKIEALLLQFKNVVKLISSTYQCNNFLQLCRNIGGSPFPGSLPKMVALLLYLKRASNLILHRRRYKDFLPRHCSIEGSTIEDAISDVDGAILSSRAQYLRSLSSSLKAGSSIFNHQRKTCSFLKRSMKASCNA